MKKHLFGLAMFSFIFASFAIAFAYIYAPAIWIVEEVREPVFENDTHYRCVRREENSRFEVVSTQFDLDSKKLISKIKMKLDGQANVPNRVLISTNLYTEQQLEVEKFEIKDERIEHFQIRRDTNEAIFEIVSDLSKSQKLNSQENFYVKFEISATYLNPLELKDFSTEVKSVLFVHGESSITQK